jgi:hypothetical protein
MKGIKVYQSAHGLYQRAPVSGKASHFYKRERLYKRLALLELDFIDGSSNIVDLNN